MDEEELATVITQHEAFGQKKLGNLTIENASFWGRPNFQGEEDQFRDPRRKFTVIIPNESADELRLLGWNVRTTLPTAEKLAIDPDAQPISSIKVMLNFTPDPDHPGDVKYEKGPDVWVIMGEDREKLTSLTVGLLDRSRVHQLDMEIRAWNYNSDEVKQGLEEPKFSARLVQLVAVIQPSLLDKKYGGLR